MAKLQKVRLRTFILPLAGVLLYFFSQIVGAIATTFIFRVEDPERLTTNYMGSILFIGALLSLFILFVWFLIDRKVLKAQLMYDVPSPQQAVFVIPVALALLYITGLYMLLVQFLAKSNDLINSLNQDYLEQMNIYSPDSKLQKIVLILAVGILVPIVEELIFRGLILSEFRSTMKDSTAIFLSALIFALMHGQPIQIGYALVGGLILGVFYVYTRSIWFTIGMHIVFNFAGGIIPMFLPEEEALLSSISILSFLSIFFAAYFFSQLRKDYRLRAKG